MGGEWRGGDRKGGKGKGKGGERREERGRIGEGREMPCPPPNADSWIRP